MQNKVNIKISVLSSILTAVLWFFYPMAFARVCHDHSVWVFFITFHIVYCLVLAVHEYRTELGPHVVNNQGAILFPGIEVYENDFSSGHPVKKYGTLQHDAYRQSWMVRWENQPFSYWITKPEELRYEPHDNERRYFDIRHEGFAVASDAPVTTTEKMPSDELR